MKITQKLLPVTALLSLLLVACSAGVSTTAAPAPEAKATDQAPPTECEEGKEPWRSPGPPKRGGTMVGASSAPDHLDGTAPGRNALTGGAAQVNQGLVEKRGCYFEDIVMTPRLAKSWQVSPDGLTWTLTMRNDVKWQSIPPVNGRPFTSRDVAWTIDHQKAGGLLRAFWDQVSHQEPDEQTVVLTLKEPDADFLIRLGYSDNFMMAREIKEQHGDFKSVAIGTGPYLVKDFRAGRGVTLERNPNYYEMGIDGKPLPYLDGVQSMYFGDRASEIAALRTGQIDYTFSSTVQQRDADSLKAAKPDLRFIPTSPYSQVMLFFKLNKAPWNDARVRRAVALAIDREDLISTYLGAAAGATFVPIAFKEVTWPEAKIQQQYRQDVEQAKKLLAEAGYQQPSAPIMISTVPGNAEQTEIIQAQLQAIGIRTQVAVEDRSGSSLIASGNFELAVAGTGSFPYVSHWVGDLVRTGSSLNYTGLSDARMDSLAKMQSAELDPVKRKALIDQIHDRLYELMPYVPTVSAKSIQSRSCRLRNAAFVQPADNPH